jgi:hypothetical protein
MGKEMRRRQRGQGSIRGKLQIRLLAYLPSSEKRAES